MLDSQLIPNGSATRGAEFCGRRVSISSNLIRPAGASGELSPSVLCLFYAISRQSNLTAVQYVCVSLEPRQRTRNQPQS